ncbi:MAG: putative glycoside hydrolase [Ruminococcus sp.]|nr:putative glycoside hydrolase [Ruminococcus sp.]
MKIKNKGRKIYKTKEKNYYGKSPAGKFFSALLSVLLIGGIGFIGYSVAGPLINYTRKQGDEEPPESETVPEEEQTSGEIQTEDADDAVLPVVQSENDVYRAVFLSEYDMTSTESIKIAVGRIPQEQGIEYIEVPLKLKNGKLTYESSSPVLTDSDIVQPEITLQEIAHTIKKEGYTPSAHISVFADSTIPKIYPQYSYMIKETLSVWQDSNSNLWASPFSSDYTDYLTFLADEISGAGFEKIICSDLSFPEFSDRDIEELNDPRIENDGRYTALTDTANILYEKITADNSEMLIEVSASDVISGKSEVLKPLFLNSDTIVLNINLDEISRGVNTGDTVYEFNGTVSENVLKMLDLAKDRLSDFNVTVRISGGSGNTSDILKAKDDMAENGYTSFILG